MSEGSTAAGAARRASSGTVRLTRAWRVLPHESRLAAFASVSLFVTLFLPWYQVTLIAPAQSAKLQSASAAITGWGAFSFVEAAVLLVAAGVLILLFQRADGRAFHLPGGDGGVITAAGLWTCALIVWRIFDKQGATTQGPSATSSGVEWGIFVALAAAAFLAYSGSRIRAAHRPEPPLPGEDRAPVGSNAAADTTEVPRRRERSTASRRRASAAESRWRESADESLWRDSVTDAPRRDEATKVGPRDAATKVRRRDAATEARQRDAATEARQRDAATEVRTWDAPPELRTWDDATKVRPRDAPAEVRGRDAPTEARSRDAPTEVRGRDAPTEARPPDAATEGRRRARNPPPIAADRAPAPDTDRGPGDPPDHPTEPALVRPRRRFSADELFERVVPEDPPSVRFGRIPRAPDPRILPASTPSSMEPAPPDDQLSIPFQDDATLPLGEDVTVRLGEDATLPLPRRPER